MNSLEQNTSPTYSVLPTNRSLQHLGYGPISLTHRITQTWMLVLGISTGLMNVKGAEQTWTGAAGDNLWSTPGNWSGGEVPTVEDVVEIPSASEVIVTDYLSTGVLINRGFIRVKGLPRVFGRAGGAALIVKGGSNHGRIFLKSEGTELISALNIQGVFTNEVSGRIEGGFEIPTPLDITGHLINRGAVTCEGGILEIVGPETIYEMEGGVLGENVRVKNSEIRLRKRAPADTRLGLWGSVNLTTSVPRGVELLLEATGRNDGSAYLQATNLLNEGRITIQPSSAQHRCEIKVTGVCKNAGIGEIETVTKTGTGNVYISATILNEGALRFGTYTRIDGVGASTNLGSIFIGKGAKTDFLGDRWVNESSGQIEGAGRMGIDQTRFENHGSVQVRGSTDQFLIDGHYVQLGGITRLNGGEFVASKGIWIGGGELKGPGKVDGSVTNFGRVHTGIAPGTLVITKHYIEHPSARLQWTLAGLEAGISFVPLYIGGTAILNGLREFTLAGLQPTETSQLEIARFLTSSHPKHCFVTRIDAGGFLLEEQWLSDRLTLAAIPYRPQDTPILSIEHCADRTVRLQIEGRPQTGYALQTSYDLKEWTSLVSIASKTGYIQYTDIAAPEFDTRYYRVQEETAPTP